MSNKTEFNKLTSSQQQQLHLIHPVNDSGLMYYPCTVILLDGEKKDRVYIVEAERFCKKWGAPPEERYSLPIEEVTEIHESLFRLPVHIAQRIYNDGESGMGYYAFTLKFNDETTQSCGTGDAIDFVPLPEGKKMSDIVDVQLHTRGIDPNRKEGLDYYWCLYSE